MKRKFPTACYVVIGLFFWSCASIPSASIPTTFNVGENEGMIIGSISIENVKPIFNGYFLNFKQDSLDSKSRDNRISIRPEQLYKMKFKPDLFDGTKAVHFFGLRRPAGKYHFTVLELFRNGGMVISNTKIPFDLDFEIKPGEINYIGEVEFNYHLGQLRLNHKSERDLPILKDRFPDISWELLK